MSPKPHRKPAAKLAVLVLLCGTGLLTIGLVSLWQSLQNAEAAAREEARRAAQTTARALQAFCARPEVLDCLPDKYRFEFLEGLLQLPAGLDDLSPDKAMPEPGFLVQAKLEQVRRLEYREGKRAEAMAVLDLALTNKELDAWQWQTLSLAAAWQAQRFGEFERRDALLTRIENKERGEILPSQQLSSLLLHAVAGKPRPPYLREAFLRLTPQRARSFHARLREIGSGTFLQGADLSALVKEVDSLWARRETLERVRSVATRLIGKKKASLELVGDRVLLFFPNKPENGRGALIESAELLHILEVEAAKTGHKRSPALPAFAWSGKPVLATTAAERAIPLYQGAWIEPEQQATNGIWSNPWLLTSLLLVLALSLASGLFTSFRSMRREEEALQARSEFLTSVTHELKTPLASIRMFTEMLAEGRVPSEAKRDEYYRLLAGEAYRLSALVENVLDLGRMERGERAYDLRTLDLAALVGEAVELFAPIAEANGMRVESKRHGPSNDKLLVSADRNALLQAFLNLFENARKYAWSGKHLELVLNGSTELCRLQIRDRGPGVPQEERERIFDRFRRGNEQKNGAVPGVGLGLYLARRILRAHAGELVCKEPEDAGEGACFEVTLPRLQEPRQEEVGQ